MINSTDIEFVKEIKYLGYIFTYNCNDDAHVESLYRGLCVRSNTVFRNFSKCDDNVKEVLFKSFCTSFYCLPAVIRVKVSIVNKLRVCYNNSFRKIFNTGRQCSISSRCVRMGIPTFKEQQRKCVVSLLARFKASNNTLVKSFTNVNYLHTTMLFSSWRPLAYC